MFPTTCNPVSVPKGSESRSKVFSGTPERYPSRNHRSLTPGEPHSRLIPVVKKLSSLTPRWICEACQRLSPECRKLLRYPGICRIF
jgi:hypothetical protein